MCILPGMPQRAVSGGDDGGLALEDDLLWLDYTFGADGLDIMPENKAVPAANAAPASMLPGNPDYFAEDLQFADPFSKEEDVIPPPPMQQQMQQQQQASISTLQDFEKIPIQGFEGYFYSSHRRPEPILVPSAVVRSVSGSSADTVNAPGSGSASVGSGSSSSVDMQRHHQQMDDHETTYTRFKRGRDVLEVPAAVSTKRRHEEESEETSSPMPVYGAPSSPSGFSSPGLAEEMEYDQGRWKPDEIAMVMNITRVYVSHDLKTISDIANFCGIRRPKRAIDKHLKRMLKYDRWLNRDEANILAKIAVRLQETLPPLTKAQIARLEEAQATWQP